jgi:hypothetical protein
MVLDRLLDSRSHGFLLDRDPLWRLQDSMRRFDDPARGKPVANIDAIEQPPPGHEKQETDNKGLLH